jgi:hypothetical protein
MTRSNQDTQNIVDHVEDTVASESRIEEALGRPLAEVDDDPEGRAAVRNLHDMVKQHRDAPVTMPEEVGTTA